MVTKKSDSTTVELRTLGEFFLNYEYSIPNYQRDYAWKAKQVEDLLRDLEQFVRNREDDYYVLGQIITAPGKGKSHSLVDGQQRTTTIYLLLLALHKHLGELTSDEVVEGARFTIEQILWRYDGSSPKKSLRFTGVKNGQQTLHALVSGEAPQKPISVSDKNLVRNFELIRQWIGRQKFLHSGQGVWDFLNRILSDVTVVCLELANETQAIDFFIKLNSRGLKLNAADLMKGLILKNATEEDYEAADAIWQKAASQISQVWPNGAASMEFLLGAMIRKRTGQRVSKDQLYFEWEKQILVRQRPFENLRKNKSLSAKISVSEFVTQLSSDAEALQMIGSARTPHGLPATELRGTRLFKSFQHYNVLLAGAKLPSDAYKHLCRAIEARTILQIFSDEPSQDYERILPPWAHRIGELILRENRVSVEDIRLASAPAFADTARLMERVEPTIRRLRYADDAGGMRQRDISRIRFVLAKTAKATQRDKAEQVGFPLSFFLETTSETGESNEQAIPRDIDHVLPKSQKSIQKYWPSDYPIDLIHSLGNLVLLWGVTNKEMGAKSPPEKVEAYLKQDLALTQALAIGDVPEEKTAHEKAVKYWKKAQVSLREWGPDDIELRTRLYVELFMKDLESSIQPFFNV